jgi:hypothetical protein
MVRTFEERMYDKSRDTSVITDGLAEGLGFILYQD